MGLMSGLSGFVETVFGPKASAALARDALESVNLGNSAVRYSHAINAKKIINQAINADAIGSDYKDVAKAISSAFKKDTLNGTFEFKDGTKLGINDAINRVIRSGITTEGKDAAFKESVKAFTEKGMGKKYAQYMSGEINAAQALGREADEGLGIAGTFSGFFNDFEYGKTRAKMVAGGGFAAGVGLRYLSGGDLTHTDRGERDIAGIPFV